MRVWLVTIGEPLPVDGRDERLMRAGILSTFLACAGHEVVWWSSTFDHVRKRHRCSTDVTYRLESGVTLKLLHGCGYSRNVSIRRIIDHALLSRKFRLQAGELSCPDVILCSLPPLELSVAATRYGKAREVPVVVDVRDLWPDIFLELVPAVMRPIVSLCLAPMRRQARAACREAFAITANSPSFVEWALHHAQRDATELDRHHPFGYDVPELSKNAKEKAVQFWDAFGIKAGNNAFVACYFGAIGDQSDFDTVIEAAWMLEADGLDVRFVICGAGERLEELRVKARGSQSLIFPGWVGRAEIWTLMTLSNVGLVPFKNHVGYVGNLPNKPIEYMAGGLPIVSGLHGYLEELLDRHQCGVTYEPGNARALCSVIKRLMHDSEQLTKLSINVRQLFAEHFDAKRVYGEMIAYLQEVVAAFAARPRPN